MYHIFFQNVAVLQITLHGPVVADAVSVIGRGPQAHSRVAEEGSQGLLSACTVNSAGADIENEIWKGDEQDQSTHDAQPGTLARIIQRYPNPQIPMAKHASPHGPHC